MTGGSRGIGRAVVHGMASLGHRVIFTYNSSSKSTVQSVCDAYPDGMVTATCLDQGNKKEDNDCFSFFQNLCLSRLYNLYALSYPVDVLEILPDDGHFAGNFGSIQQFSLTVEAWRAGR